MERASGQVEREGQAGRGAEAFRAETVGSLLRPDYLREARRARDSGELPNARFKRIEDRAVDEAIELQERCGLDVVTDGEMRRILFTGTLTEVVAGIERVPGEAMEWRGASDSWEYRNPMSVVGRVRPRRSLAAEELSYARARARMPLKVTLPSPLMLFVFWSPTRSRAAYGDPFELFADAAEILRQEVRELAELGCEYVQIDAPELGALVDERQREHYEAVGITPDRLLTEGVELLGEVTRDPPEGVSFALHVCRGNNQGRWMAEGGYEAIVDQVLARARGFGKLLLEYDDYRSGSFEPLERIPHDRTVVLGLVSTKRDEVEPRDAVEARVNEAARHFPLERLAVSTQCGFASTAAGNPVSPATQEAKLRLVAGVARGVWGP
jgi:5-methyltetrahydropteroyltriglutamate--homocysteine methyltransferase